MKVLVIYDDTGKKSEAITDIIGEKGFGEVVVNKRGLEDSYRDVISGLFDDVSWQKIVLPSVYPDLLKRTELYEMDDVRVLHLFSNYMISKEKKASLSFQKLKYIEEPFGVLHDKRAVCAMFPDIKTYQGFLKNIIAGGHAWDIARNIPSTFDIDGILDIGETANFLACITGNFDSRYFNSLKEDHYTVVKQSANKEKIHSEYMFYRLIPEDMQYWFVQPYDYSETEDSASYRMERLHMTDLAIKWVHGSMGMDEFSKLMDRYFYFFSCRHERSCGKDTYRAEREKLYVTKVCDRVAALKEAREYDTIKGMLMSSGQDLDEYVDQYMRLREKLEPDDSPRQVIGHGDPCFSNALYNKTTQTLKFIDPKGALEESDLWTDPYYDVAKLSHSVCGNYDFINNSLYEIRLDKDFKYSLEIPFDNTNFKEVFREKAEENGFDYRLLRLYEASLFLSMLPLHIDNPHKVFAFIINAGTILKEIEENA